MIGTYEFCKNDLETRVLTVHDTDPKAIEISCGEIRCITFNPDGCHLVGVGNSGNLRQWKVESGEVSPSVMKLTGHVSAVAASMDGQWIVSGNTGKKKEVIVWSAVTHKIAIQISEHIEYVYTVDVSNDSTRFASGSHDCTVRIFDIISGVRVIPPLQHNNAIAGVKFSPDGSRIATATFKHSSVRIYDAYSGDKLFNVAVQVTRKSLTPLSWSSDDQQLFVASSDKITYFDTSTSFRSEWPIENGSNNVSVVTHGQFIACSAGSSVSFWEYTSRKQIGNVVDHATAVNCISISHDGRYLACGRDEGITVHSLSDFIPRDYLLALRISRIPLMQLSDAALESWRLGNPTETESILSEEIAQCSDPNHHALAARSLIRSRLREWRTAIDDAEMVALSLPFLILPCLPESMQSPSRSNSHLSVRLHGPSPSLVQVNRKLHLMNLTSCSVMAIRVITCFSWSSRWVLELFHMYCDLVSSYLVCPRVHVRQA